MIGRIQIFDNHSLVDLPKGMPEDVFNSLATPARDEPRTANQSGLLMRALLAVGLAFGSSGCFSFGQQPDHPVLQNGRQGRAAEGWDCSSLREWWTTPAVVFWRRCRTGQGSRRPRPPARPRQPRPTASDPRGSRRVRDGSPERWFGLKQGQFLHHLNQLDLLARRGLCRIKLLSSTSLSAGSSSPSAVQPGLGNKGCRMSSLSCVRVF